MQNRKSKLFIAVLASISALTLTACGGDDKKDSSKRESIPASSQASLTPVYTQSSNAPIISSASATAVSTSANPNPSSASASSQGYQIQVTPEQWYSMNGNTNLILATASDGLNINFTGSDQAAVFFNAPGGDLFQANLEVTFTPSTELVESGADIELFYRLGCGVSGAAHTTITNSELTANQPMTARLLLDNSSVIHPRAGKEFGLRAVTSNSAQTAAGTLIISSARLVVDGNRPQVNNDICYITPSSCEGEACQSFTETLIQQSSSSQASQTEPPIVRSSSSSSSASGNANP